MKTYTVTLIKWYRANEYCDVEVRAESEEDAKRVAFDTFEEDGKWRDGDQYLGDEWPTISSVTGED